MPNPVLFAIDDDPEVVRAVGRDLKRRYGDRYRVLQAGSGEDALATLAELKRRDEAVALLLADQRMPTLSGTEFLAQATELFPSAKRMLLTAYADTSAAIDAINRAGVDYYLLKPWHPPEEHLFPILDGALDDWRVGYRPPFEGLKLVAPKWSANAHQIKAFLARNQIPYQWLDVEAGAAGRRLLEVEGLTDAALPVVVMTDGSHLTAATPAAVADRIGLKTRAETQFYDFAIVGAGPAGLAAAVYGASEGLATLLIERHAPGGQAGESSKIENYLGFPAGVSGSELARRAATQALRFGAEVLCPQEVTELQVDGSYRRLRLADGGEVACHALLVATGVRYRRLAAPGIDALTGAGVYYGAAVAEASSMAGGDAFVVGGGNSAGQAAMYLSSHARQVTIVIRGKDLGRSMSRYLIDQIASTPNIAVRSEVEVAGVEGSGHLESITLRHGSGRVERCPAAGLFIFIGAAPHADWLGSAVRRDEKGFVLTGGELANDLGRVPDWPLAREPYLLETSVPGVFAAGDVRRSSMKRVASGVGEGSMAVSFVHQYLATL